MSKKHFEKMAETIRFMDVTPEIRMIVAKDFANMLKGSNPRFDSERFIKEATKNMLGWMSPNAKVTKNTPLVEAFENGEVFLLNEVD